MTADLVAEATRALRSIRATSYRVESTGDGAAVTLVIRASPNGRRNAADRIVAALRRGGLVLDAGDDDPIHALADHVEPVAVRRAPQAPTAD
ncbi:hypothetical protein FHR81_001859 [Actinoalloteichus hoggarensis]|uniref:Uncharacterized protein n=1 Tax=Actinoalloteichus hoggarensis TaxID=1470176 RepID=A0A221W4S0_9PSEU|nr:hypothetical protein [Actinoalloteichus hoggarensis]ASO20890.1 hypothetical protein AHOG_16320 [Actinoalloteichus hoggarensis]MBB5920821.1 hypothetical protein [Actinoalloteichus hoggarensis]